jgi:hypothetical protein
MNKILMKWLATGEILELWQSEDHPDATPGRPIWTDALKTNWGVVNKWPVPYGFIRMDDPDINLFSPVLADYWKLKSFFALHYISSYSLKSKIEIPGLPQYVIKQYETLGGEYRLVVIFDEKIIIPSGERSDRFVIWSKPAIKLNSSGTDQDWIPYF